MHLLQGHFCVAFYAIAISVVIEQTGYGIFWSIFIKQ